jgi:hypothetical protein
MVFCPSILKFVSSNDGTLLIFPLKVLLPHTIRFVNVIGKLEILPVIVLLPVTANVSNVVGKLEVSPDRIFSKF